MKTINRRLRRLEGEFGPEIETEAVRRLRERLEAGRRRVAEARERGECGPPVEVLGRREILREAVMRIGPRGPVPMKTTPIRARIQKLEAEALPQNERGFTLEQLCCRLWG